MPKPHNSFLNATGENNESKAINRADEFYIKMTGNSVAVPQGGFVKLMEIPEQPGSVTSEDIAEVLDTPKLPIEGSCHN